MLSPHFVGVPTAPKGEVAPLWNPPVLKSRKAYCKWAGKTYRPERASCPRWPESSSMTPLRFYWFCPFPVSRDNKNQRKSHNALTRSNLRSSKNLQSLPSSRNFRRKYPGSLEQFCSLNRSIAGSLTVKEVPAWRPVWQYKKAGNGPIYVSNSLHYKLATDIEL